MRARSRSSISCRLCREAALGDEGMKCIVGDGDDCCAAAGTVNIENEVFQIHHVFIKQDMQEDLLDTVVLKRVRAFSANCCNPSASSKKKSKVNQQCESAVAEEAGAAYSLFR